MALSESGDTLLHTISKSQPSSTIRFQNVARGQSSELKIGSVPGIANVMVPLAIADVRRRYPELLIEIDVLKIEDAIDYLPLGRGEVVVMSSRIDHSALSCAPLATGQLYCIVSKPHALASRASIGIAEIADHPLIGSGRRGKGPGVSFRDAGPSLGTAGSAYKSEPDPRFSWVAMIGTQRTAAYGPTLNDHSLR